MELNETIASTSMSSPELINHIHFYLVPPLVLLGTVGNLMSLAVFRCTKLRRLSTSYYLTALSLSDTVFLISLFAVWLDMAGVTLYNKPILCQFFTYTSHVCCFLSPWLVVTFTVERFIATCYPLKRAAVCTVSRAKVVVFVLTFIATASYSYLFVVAGGTQPCRDDLYVCGLKLDYVNLMNVLNSLDTFVTLVIPVALIVGLNFQIGCAVWQFEQVRKRMTSSQHNCNCSMDSLNVTSTSALQNNTRNPYSNAAGTNREPRGGVTHSGRYQIKITKMLLMISSIFVGLNAPSYVMRLLIFYRNDQAETSNDFINTTCVNFTSKEDNVDGLNVTTSRMGPAESDVNYVMGQSFQFIFYLNFAINFLLYCVCGENFRKALLQLLWKVSMFASKRNSAFQRTGGGMGCVGVSNGSSRQRWSRRNTGTIVISTQMLMTEAHPSPAAMTKSKSGTPVTSI